MWCLFVEQRTQHNIQIELVIALNQFHVTRGVVISKQRGFFSPFLVITFTKNPGLESVSE